MFFLPPGASCIRFTQEILHVRGLIPPWPLAHKHPFLPALLCPNLSGALGSTWDMKANIITLDVHSGLFRLPLPNAPESLFILSNAGMWVKRLRSLSGSAVLASYTALSKLLSNTGEARWLVLGMFKGELLIRASPSRHTKLEPFSAKGKNY